MSDETNEETSPERAEAGFREQHEDLEAQADRLEQRNEELEDDIGEAKRVAAQRPDAPDDANEPPEGTENVAGDWEGEASGADQGDDAQDSGDIDDG